MVIHDDKDNYNDDEDYSDHDMWTVVAEHVLKFLFSSLQMSPMKLVL